MVEAPERLGLAPEPPDARGGERPGRRVQDLERDRASEPRVLGEPDGALPSAAQEAHEAERADPAGVALRRGVRPGPLLEREELPRDELLVAREPGQVLAERPEPPGLTVLQVEVEEVAARRFVALARVEHGSAPCAGPRYGTGVSSSTPQACVAAIPSGLACGSITKAWV